MREQYVFELHRYRKTTKDIAMIVHISFDSIGAIINKYTDYDNNESNESEKEKEPILNSTKAFKLFSEQISNRSRH
jgi:hypothetical protein